ncbi:MAG: hypothetical protein JW850_18490, partial [Thermoflexales bacterium]|nr:hypothetical protein [Thermoflexales bacterium]
PAAPGEAVPPGYVPPDPGQTVRDWVTAQCDPEQDEEKAFYMGSVIPAFMAAGAHASTEHNTGKLTEKAVLAMGERLFYNPPPAPGNPAQDHEVIMEWLAFLRDSAAAIEGLYCQARRAGAAVAVGLSR